MKTVKGTRAPLPGPATWVTLVMLGVTAVLSNTVLFRQVIQGTSDLTRGIPSSLGPWMQIDEAPASPNEIRGLETRDIVKRVYSDGSTTIELVVAYIAHSSRKSAHAQEACLRGSGAMVGSIESRALQGTAVLAKSISIDLNDRRQHVYYWYKIGHSHTANYLISSLKMFLAGLWGGKSQGASLVRLLTPVAKGENQRTVDARLENFTRFLVPELERVLP